MTTPITREQMIEALRLHIDAGADEAIADETMDRFAESAMPATRPAPARAPATAEARPARPAAPEPQAAPPPAAPRPAAVAPPAAPAPRNGAALNVSGAKGGAAGGAMNGHELAAAANTIEDLRAALLTFDGCALRQTATNLVFCDGNPRARIVFVGEAPGAEEDRQGLPFVGPAGKLLDRMLAAIGLDRGSALITNTIYWRPPGNRNPSPDEVAACLPFVERVIEIVDPAVLVLVGGIASKTLLATNDGIMKLRGKWRSFETPRMSRPVPCMPIFHPAFLLRSPGQKRLAWRDLIEIRRRLDAEGA